jgi:hypothetical protein
MGDPRDRKSMSPHTTALMASFAVLLTGSAVSTYFVQVRGVGWSALFAGSLGPELVIVCGAMAALAVVVHLSVARALGAAQNAQTPRMMIRRALEVLDAPEFGATELEDLPTEVRDLVAAFAAQKSREQQLERELQAMHRGTRELVQRLEQSGAKLESLNAEAKDELATRVARAWNPLVEQVRLSRDQARAMPAAPPFSPAALFAREESDSGPRVEETSGDVARRLGELESNLSMLWNEMRGLQAFVPETSEAPANFPTASQPPLLNALQKSESRPMPAAPPMPPPMFEPPALVTLPETRTFEALQVVPGFAAMPEVVAEPEAIVSPWTAPEMPAFDSVESVPVSPAEDIRWATSEVLQPDRSTKASESGYFAWTGQSTQEGSWKLRDEAPEELRRSDEEKTKAEAAAPHVFVDDTYPELPPRLPAAPPGTAMPASPPMAAPMAPATPGVASPSFESHFPHFVGKPVQQLDGRVEVSFEGSTSERPEAPRAGGTAKRSGPETPGATPKFDLHSLGALEIDE